MSIGELVAAIARKLGEVRATGAARAPEAEAIARVEPPTLAPARLESPAPTPQAASRETMDEPHTRWCARSRTARIPQLRS